MIKKIIIAVLVVIALPFIVALFVKKEYVVERSIVINKPVPEVFAYVKYVKNQDHFSKWNTVDSAMKKAYKGVDGTVGFVYAWDSENEQVGKGEQEITSIQENDRIDFELRFFKPWESTGKAYFNTLSTDPQQTKVMWGFSGYMAYPSNLMLLFMDFDAMLGGDLETGLSNLKNVMEKEHQAIP